MKIKSGDLVMPGDYLGIVEQYLPGEGTYDDDGNISVYASTYDPNSSEVILGKIETENEWKVVETILNTIQQEVRQADNIENSNEQE